jgi:hypothetical protein
MTFDPKFAMIEYYGPLVRIGVFGKWVEFIKRPPGPKNKKAMLELIEEMDRERTQ